MTSPAEIAAETLRSGGVIAYPTEGVFGLGCLPENIDAVERVLRIKQRDPAKGLILIAANVAQLHGWIDTSSGPELPEADEDRPITWIVPAHHDVAPAVRGNNPGIAVRISSHPIARSICKLAGSPLVSTSANLSGQPVAKDQAALHEQFGGLVDYIVPGDCGQASGPTEIRVLATGEVLRSR